MVPLNFVLFLCGTILKYYYTCSYTHIFIILTQNNFRKCTQSKNTIHRGNFLNTDNFTIQMNLIWNVWY
jgi:hypothetical protein